MSIISRWLDKLPFLAPKEALPPRVLAMPLDLPPLIAHSRFFRRSNQVGPPPLAWKELGPHPIELLRDIDRYLKLINAERVPLARRLRWVDISLQFACPAIRRIYSDHHKGDAVPESHDRREGLMAAINVCAQLATGYKHSLRHDYDLSDRRYQHVRARVQRCAMHILELIRMEQRLRALRYQKLAPATWLDCNRVYFAIRQIEDMQQLRKALPCLQIHADTKQGDLARRSGISASMEQVYLSIQLYGLMDTNSIACNKLHVIDAQVSKVLPQLRAAKDNGAPLANGEVIVYSNQDRPAFFERQDEKAEAALARERARAMEAGELMSEQRIPVALRIDLISLAESLRQEHARLLQVVAQQGSEDAPKASADTQDIALLLAVDAMCDKLQLKRRRENREYPVEQKVIYIYAGFMPVYQLLLEAVASGEEDDEVQGGSDNQLRDALAERSAIITTEGESGEAGQWFVLDYSAGGVHLKTEDSRFITPLFIGQLVAFAYSSRDLHNPTLAYVTRLSRGVQGMVEVTLRILAHELVATALQSEFLSQSEMALPAIHAKLPDGGEGLVVHQSHRQSPGTKISLTLDGEACPKLIGETHTLQREFILYHLQ